jgi:microcin C transport system substrate-binding protein
MVHYARALDRVLQWGYYMIPNYYPPARRPCGGTASACPAVQPAYDEGLNTWWGLSHADHATDARPAAGASDMLRYLSRRLLLIIPTLLCICWSIS